MNADVGTFALGTLFGIVTTVAVFRASLTVLERRVRETEVQLDLLERFVNRVADELAEKQILFVRREADR